MPKYISLLNWTEQGMRAIRDSPRRLDAAREAARKYDCAIEDFYMTFGPYDMVVILDAPDDEAAATFNLHLGMAGNVRTVTLKAFEEEDYRRVLGSF